MNINVRVRGFVVHLVLLRIVPMRHVANVALLK